MRDTVSIRNNQTNQTKIEVRTLFERLNAVADRPRLTPEEEVAAETSSALPAGRM